MPYRIASLSWIGLAAGTSLMLAACGSESPETAQSPAAPPGVVQGDSSRQGTSPAPDTASAPGASGTSSSIPATSDGTLVAMVESAIAAEPELNDLDIEVIAVDGTVYLRGEAHTRESRRLATEVVSSVDGVREVENELFVRAGTEQSKRPNGPLTALR